MPFPFMLRSQLSVGSTASPSARALGNDRWLAAPAIAFVSGREVSGCTARLELGAKWAQNPA